ncbi:MAG: hypothetical protein ACOCP4_02745 [Candidatus Woesearchaeota archaeon]
MGYCKPGRPPQVKENSIEYKGQLYGLLKRDLKIVKITNYEPGGEYEMDKIFFNLNFRPRWTYLDSFYLFSNDKKLLKIKRKKLKKQRKVRYFL